MAMNFDRVPSYVKKEIAPPKNVVRSGASGIAVKRIQEWLQFHEFSTAIDGQYGPATASCVKDFQNEMGLSKTGTVNKSTWETLVGPLTRSLSEPVIEGNEDAALTVKRVAEQHLAQGPIEIGGPNCGPWVRVYCAGNDGPEWAWCAGFVTLIMQQAYFYRGEKVPISGSVSCDTIAAQAQLSDRFVTGKSIKTGKRKWADVGGPCFFLLKRTDNNWVHTGLVTDAQSTSNGMIFQTIEGNTNNNGSREGFKATFRKRSLAGADYDFVRLSEI